MNYKGVIRSRQFRIKLLTFFNWMPDEIMVRLQYFLKTGRKLHLKKPKRFTEKLQLYKLRYRNIDMLRCTDKYEVRSYVKEKSLGKYLVPLLGVYDKVGDIDFERLPNCFVAKTTDGGGGNQVLVCRDKALLSKMEFEKRLNSWLAAPKPKKSIGREWAYENNFPRRIIVEELIGDKDQDLVDYKFFCFNGKVGFVYGLSDRAYGESVQLGVYDKDFNKLDVNRRDERPQMVALKRPLHYDEMVRVSEILSKDFPHVRVDLYNVNGQIYFGELTFYDGSGYMSFDPDGFDEYSGGLFDISKFVKRK